MSADQSPLPAGIEHVIVLMLENRSFDHLLGSLPDVSGPVGCSNIDPKDGSTVPVTFDADFFSPALPDPSKNGEMVGDPEHEFIPVNRQLFGVDSPGPGAPVTCGGFIAAGRQSGNADADRAAREVMKCFDTRTKLPTMAALAAEFVVCDHWFSSVPGPTWPNRLFVHAATSFGALDDTKTLYSGVTLYDRLDAAGVDWAIYYHDIPQAACLHELIDREDHADRRCMRQIDNFYQDVSAHRADPPARRTLPSYVFIEPGYFEPAHTIGGRFVDLLKSILHFFHLPVKPSKTHPNDQHSPHDVRLGEHLIADVYDALRANEEVWQHCLFVVLHDEHGGLYDHEHPGPAVPPDSHRAMSPPFAFDRLGLRVPAILISPYLHPQIDHTAYEHASIVRMVRTHFCPGAQPLTDRDAAAAVPRRDLFADTPRTDAMKRSPRPAAIIRIARAGDPATRPVNALQSSLVNLAAAIVAPSLSPGGVASATPAGMAADATRVAGTARPPSPGLSEAAGRAYVMSQLQLRQSQPR